MELPTSARSIAPRHWTGHAHSGFSARPDHSIPPVVSIRPIDRFSISILLRLSSFKISSCVSNPTISISQGGITKLALIGVGGISSGPPGGTLTFAGLDSVLLATQNGSIILGGGISFQNIPNLFFYARGDSVSLKLASPISGASNLLLNSEGTVQVNGNVSVNNFNAFSNGDFLDGSGIITAHDVTINSIGGNVTFDAQQISGCRGRHPRSNRKWHSHIYTGRGSDHSCIYRWPWRHHRFR